jgi:hypothetical protein
VECTAKQNVVVNNFFLFSCLKENCERSFINN